MKELLEQVGKIIEDSNASNFEIMGRKYLNTMIKLIYHDRDEIWEAEYNQGEPYTLTFKGYSEEREEDYMAFKNKIEDIENIKTSK